MTLLSKHIFSISWILFLLLIISCKNSSTEKKEIDQKLDSNNTDQKFDSANNQIQKTTNHTNANPSIDALYDSVAMKYTQSMMSEFRTTVSEFRKYLHELRVSFIQFCGDPKGQKLPAESEDKQGLTKDFFKKDENGQTLYFKLTDVQRTLKNLNDKPELDEEINNMFQTPKKGEAGKFAKFYFDNTPPVAALTLLSKFENDVNMFERVIVQGFLKNNHVNSQ